MELTKVTFNLPTIEFEAIKNLAILRGVSKTQLLRQAIQTELFVQSLVDRQAKLVVEDQNGEKSAVVFTHALGASQPLPPAPTGHVTMASESQAPRTAAR